MKTKTVSIHARLDLKGSYHNHEKFGKLECHAGTSEQATVDNATYIRTGKIKEESGFEKIYQDLSPGTNAAQPWTMDGTQYIQDNDCTTPNQTINCSGKVVYPSADADAPALLVAIKGGTIHFLWSFTGAFTEKGQSSCGSKEGESFYFGLGGFMAPYLNLVGKISLAKFARNPHKRRGITMKPEHISKKYDPAHCNGAAKHYQGATCTGGGSMKAVLNLGAPLRKG